MPSINIDLDYFDHPKVKRLVASLGRGSDVLPVRLWCYVGRHQAETGDLPDFRPEDVERIIGWFGKAGRAVEVMLEVGFLERCENGFKVHDWLEWSGHLRTYRERAKNAAKVRWAKERGPPADAPSNAPSNATAMYRNEAFNSSTGACSKKHQDAPPKSFPGRGYFPELEPVAKRIVSAYQSSTRTAHGDRGAHAAVIELLAMGTATEADLTSATERWATHAKKTYKPAQRLSARNFFGGDSPAWQSWVDGSPVTEDDSGGLLDGLKAFKERGQNDKR